MKKHLIVVFLILILFLCPFCLTACNKNQGPSVVDFSVQLEGDTYELVDGVITVVYQPEILDISGADFKVTLKYDDNSSIVVRQKNINYKGFNFSSTIPTTTPAKVGEYTLTFGYGSLSPKTIKVKVIKSKLILTGYEWDYSVPYTYDGTEKIITLKQLPDNVSAQYENNRQTKTGKYTAIAHLTYVDQLNYEPLEDIEIEWEIKKANVDLSNADWNRKKFSYTGSAQSVVLQNLPAGVTATYEGNTATEVGKYTAIAHLTYVDQENYNLIEDVTLNWEIV